MWTNIVSVSPFGVPLESWGVIMWGCFLEELEGVVGVCMECSGCMMSGVTGCRDVYKYAATFGLAIQVFFWFF